MEKPTLKMKKVSYLEIECRDLDKFIQEVYDIPYFSCAAVEEWRNDSQHRICVEKEELYKWDRDKIEEVKAGKEPNYSLRAVMIDMCNQGLIEPGDYLISVCW
jgi:threonine synthase